MLLVLNAGSSSLKFALYALPLALARPLPKIEGQIAGIGRKAHFTVAGREFPARDVADHDQAIAHLLDWLEKEGAAAPVAGAGHRVVHGGGKFSQPVRIDS